MSTPVTKVFFKLQFILKINEMAVPNRRSLDHEGIHYIVFCRYLTPLGARLRPQCWRNLRGKGVCDSGAVFEKTFVTPQRNFAEVLGT